MEYYDAHRRWQQQQEQVQRHNTERQTAPRLSVPLPKQPYSQKIDLQEKIAQLRKTQANCMISFASSASNACLVNFHIVGTHPMTPGMQDPSSPSPSTGDERMDIAPRPGPVPIAPRPPSFGPALLRSSSVLLSSKPPVPASLPSARSPSPDGHADRMLTDDLMALGPEDDEAHGQEADVSGRRSPMTLAFGGDALDFDLAQPRDFDLDFLHQ